MLTGGDGNDIILGDNGVIIPVFSKGTPAWENDMLVLPQDDHCCGDNGVSDGGDDVLIGGNGDDILLGQDGDDTLDGGAGDDKLYGGQGKNTLNGGSGKNVIKKNGSPGSNYDEDDFMIKLNSLLLQHLLTDVMEAEDILDPESDLWLDFGDSKS